jgi:hypothetical protein
MVKKTLKRKKKVKKNNNIEHINRTRRRRSRYISHGGNIQGNNIRQLLVNLCKTNQWDKYDKLVTSIIQNEQVRKNLFHHLDNNIHTFSQETLECLEHFFEKLETELVDGAYRYHSGSDIRQLLVNFFEKDKTKYSKLVSIIKKDKYVRNKLYDHLDNQIHTFSENTLENLRSCFTELQEEAVEGSDKYTFYIVQNLTFGMSYKSIDDYNKSYPTTNTTA